MTHSLFSLLNGSYRPELMRIEVSSRFQIPALILIGLAGQEVVEAKERVRSAIEQSGFEFPRRRVTVNLSPPEIKKSGTGMDLAIALSILIEPPQKKICVWGELALNGELRASGNAARLLTLMRDQKLEALVFPAADRALFLRAWRWMGLEAEPPKFTLHPVETLAQAVAVCRSFESPPKTLPVSFPDPLDRLGNPTGLSPLEASLTEPGLAEELMPLQPAFQKPLAISIAGHHHLLLLGSKGTGKTSTLKWAGRLRPAFSRELLLERMLLSELTSHEIKSPIRRVSTLVRPAALTGNHHLNRLHPGEFTWAHGGVLIADEFLEWSRDSRELLREPLERGKITLTRVHGQCELPASFLFMGTANLCPCGSRTDLESDCECLSSDRERYWKKLSGPIRDRIDLLWIQKPPREEDSPNRIEAVDEVELRARIVAMQNRLKSAHGFLPGLAPPSIVEDWCRRLPPSALESVSLRDRHKIARLSLTLAAWDELDWPTSAHLLEARLYRPDRAFAR